jgi:hypothetical protein
LKKYVLGVSNPEGIAIVGETAYLGCDACNEVWSFVWNIVTGFESGRCTSAQATV